MSTPELFAVVVVVAALTALGFIVATYVRTRRRIDELERRGAATAPGRVAASMPERINGHSRRRFGTEAPAGKR